MLINIKPLSVNEAWQGRRYKTDAYKQYERDILLLLPKKLKHEERVFDAKIGMYSTEINEYEIPSGSLKITYEFGVSNKLCDWDNPVKPLQDIICKKYNINDNRIYQAIVTKVIVPKGHEFIEFNIEKYE